MEEQTLEQLKAHAYDCLANKELWERKLQQVNQAIAEKLQQPEKVEETKETPKK